MLDCDPNAAPAPGADPVLPCAALAPDERRLLRLLRLSLSDWEGRRAAWDETWETLGETPGAALLGAFEAWLEALAEGARRGLWRHRPESGWVGRDEALLTGLVSAAGRGDAEAARALAEEVVTPAAALALLQHARALGLALQDAEAPDAAPTLH